MSRITKFKLETLNKIKTDSLDTEHKIDLFINETKKFDEHFIKDSPNVRSGMRYLIGAVGLLIAFEFGFFIIERRKS